MRKTYLLVMAAILTAAGLAVSAAFSVGSVAWANEVDVLLPADPSNTGGTPLDIDPLPESSESSEASAESSEEESSREESAESSQASSAPQSSQPASSRPESTVSSRPASSAPSSAPASSNPAGPPPVDGSFTTSDGSSTSHAPSPEPSVPSSAPSSQPSSAPESSSTPSSTPSGSSTPSSAPTDGEMLRVSFGGTVTTADAYSILCRIVEAETGGSFHTEALKAQAVAAHSYIRYENAAGRTPSMPSRTPTQKTQDAVAAVLDQVLTYNGSVAFTPYHASSAGATNSSAEVWGGSYPYLSSVTSAYDPSSSYRNVQTTLSAAAVREKVESYLKITLPEDPTAWFADLTANSAGYVSQVRIPDAEGGVHTVTGRQVRENILGYAIRSHAFTVAVNGDNLIFTTNGYGHGVGMRQTGANAYAVNDGWTYAQILAHYYPGTTLK